MKIGVITLPLHTNYGGILQAYALQRVLQDIGHDAVLLDSYPKSPELYPFPLQQLFYLKRLLKKCFLLQNATPLFYEKKLIKQYPLKEHIRKFYRQHIHHIDYDKHTNLSPEEFDAIIVGSDQIWRPMYCSNIYNSYLSFAENWTNVKRIAYAVSFGVSEWEYNEEQTKECSRLAKLFDAISVREETGITLCSKHLGVDATWVLDPTLLVDTKHYMEHINNTTITNPTSMCLSYILDETEEKNDILQHILETHGYNLLEYKDIDNPDNSNVPSVEEWLKAFHDANFVFTDSFHGCVFSIIFEKPFIVYGNKERGMARFNSLLKIFGLEDRLVTDKEEAEKVISQQIDWKRVNTIKKEWQEKSLNFLKENL